MLVSGTTRTRGVYSLADQIENRPLIVSAIAVLDSSDSKVQHATAYGFIVESRQVALLPAMARDKSADHAVGPFGNGQVPPSQPAREEPRTT